MAASEKSRGGSVVHCPRIISSTTVYQVPGIIGEAEGLYIWYSWVKNRGVSGR